jgi:purine-cytosine permease-like protein
VILVFFGLLLAGSNQKLADAVGGDPIGALATLLPTWILVPFLVVAILTLVSGAVLGIYSSGLTLLSLGIRIPRPAAAGIDGVILTAGTIFVVFFATSFIGPFQSFLITLGVPMASWAGILIADILQRHRDYDEEALFDSRGRYGAFDWTSIITMLVATGIGWGFVMNQIEHTPWNDWQGYFLRALGWMDDWGYANLGVLFALVLSFVVTWIARKGRIRRQEQA